MGQRRAWLLNFEADLELAQGGAFTPRRDVALMVAGLRARHASRLLNEGDVEIDEHARLAPEDLGLEGCAWCPTPRALASIERAGAIPPRAPSLDVLKRVNDRGFNAELGQTLPDAIYSRELETLRSHLVRRPEHERWLFKRAFSVAGRGQKRTFGGEADSALTSWLRAGLRLGGIQLEPCVTIEREFSLHGMLHEGGECDFGVVCFLECDARGTWLDTRPAMPGEIEPEELSVLERARVDVAQALANAGYFGPFGIDSYRWIDAAGTRRLQERSEINARYTFGWKAGFSKRVGGVPSL